MSQRRTVLVVDDDPDIRLMVMWALRDEGYAVQTAVNGCEALQIMCDRMPDLVLLDLQMPVMDGWQFVSACQASPAHHRVPIVVMSAGRRGGEAIKLGASAFVAKPFDLDVLVRTLDSLLAG